MNRREMLKRGSALTMFACFLPPLETQPQVVEVEQPDNTVVTKVKHKGITYGLGFELEENEEHNLRFNRYLSNAVENTIRARVHNDPRFDFAREAKPR